jgi:hypothetical protein
MKRRLALLIVALAAGSAGGAEPDPRAWPAATAEHRPWTRWWWLGSAVDRPNLTRSLEEFKQAGIGGVEICPIYGAKGYEDRFIDFLSPRWVEMLAHTTTEAKRLGLGVDLTTGTGWPFGGPTVTAADASARAVLKSYDLAEGKGLGERLPEGKLGALVAVSADGQRLDLTARVKDGRLDWTAPAGRWKLYAVVQQSPVMKVKRAAPGGVGNVLDPFSPAKLGRYLAGFDKALAGFKAPLPRAHFHDSYEYYNASWTDDLFDEFRKRRGYDLSEQLPALFGDGPADTVARVKCDYRETLSDLHRDYLLRWTDWCHRYGGQSRNQAHGGPGNIIDAYAAADIPECEIYTHYAETHRPFLKMASSAAHLTGRNLASAESFTWLGEHFQVPLSKVKTATDYLFLAGVNHIFFHGIPYSPQDAPWPGWQFYAAVNFGPGGGLWRDLPAFNAYVARCQSILQSGKPDNDVLLYVPFHDVWQSPDGLLKTFTMPGTWMERYPVHAAAMELEKFGYAYDLVSDRLLAGAKVEKGGIEVGGNRYQVVVVPKCKVIPAATVKKLIDLARGGATVVFRGSLPTDVPGIGDLEKRRAELRDALKGVATDPKGARVGTGWVLVGEDVNTVYRARGVRPVPVGTTDIRGVRRAHPGGAHSFFLVNASDRPVDGWVPLRVGAGSVVLMDPLAEDRAGLGPLMNAADGSVSVYLQLQPGESIILQTLPRLAATTPAWRYTRSAGEAVPVAGTWKVEFIEGGPVLPAAYETKELASWTTRDDPELKRFAGTARYTIEFDRPAGQCVLDLGKVCESARVSLNGKPVATLFCPPYRVPVSDHLKPGRNTLTVEVTNLAANRIADMDRRKVNWKYFYDANLATHPDAKQRGVLDASKWPLFDSGLIGPVRLMRVEEFDPRAVRRGGHLRLAARYARGVTPITCRNCRAK